MSFTPTSPGKEEPLLLGQPDPDPLSPTCTPASEESCSHEQKALSSHVDSKCPSPNTTKSDGPNDDGQDALLPPPPLCSVLNTVVDFEMMPPTEHFEPQDYQRRHVQEGQSALQVPVLRVFGPIVRRLQQDDSTPTNNTIIASPQQPQQSACLYIHGAYPYMLARPVQAGPDGSGTASGCPWDSIAAVEKMLPVLTESLEAAIQDTNNNMVVNEEKTNPQQQQARVAVVRQITVVTGRGFYGYCPGPAAPFLRVEYYCPSDRWKVKRCLERGLVDLPVSVYHPKRDDDLDEQNDDNDEDLLRFNCYEGHIPYTMQFFKDWNLAGMAYIHIASAHSSSPTVKFRNLLPTSARNKQPHRQQQQVKRINDGSSSQCLTDKSLSLSLFLASNTPICYTWTERGEVPVKARASVSGESAMPHGVDLLPARSGNPAMNEYEDVVSARQGSDRGTFVNRQVDAANNAIIEKKQTSCDLELDICVTSILNVFDVMTELPKDWEERQRIHWRAVPSLREIWSQERRRMAKLLKPQDDFLSCCEQDDEKTPPFTLNVKKDASLPGAKLAREGMQKLVQVTDGIDENFCRAMKQIVDRHADGVNRADAILRERRAAVKAEDGAAAANGLSLSCFDSIDKNASGLAFEQAATSRDSNNLNNLTPSFDETMEALGMLGGLFESSPLESTGAEQPERHNTDEDSQSSNPDGSSYPPKMSQDSSRLSQSSRETRFQSLSQSYYASANDGSRKAYKQSLAEEFELSQRVERGDGIVPDGPFTHIDDVIDPETLTPYEDIDDEDSAEVYSEDDEEANMDESKIEQVLSTLATQIFRPQQQATVEDHSIDDDSSLDSVALLSRQRHEMGAGSSDNVCAPRTSPVGDMNGDELANGAVIADLADEAHPLRGRVYDSWRHPSDVDIAFGECPPTRAELIESASLTALHPMALNGDAAPWTTYVAEHEKMRRLSRSKDDWFPSVGPRGVEVQPVHSAPTYTTVASWHQRRCKRPPSPSGAEDRFEIKRSRVANNSRGLKQSAARLRIDENSRKLVAEPAADSGAGAMDIEEVDWELSQSETLSATQEAGNLKDSQELSESEKGASQSTNVSRDHVQSGSSGTTQTCSTTFEAQTPNQALQGMGNQGGKLWVERGGQLKARTKQTQLNALPEWQKDGNSSGGYDTLPSPVSVMAIEIFIQCRTGGPSDSRIAMTPDPNRDQVLAVVYVYGRDPGGGEPLEFFERACLFVPVGREAEQFDKECNTSVDGLSGAIRKSMPKRTLGISAPLTVECVRDERQLLLRLASIVRWKDPDMLLSWDTQGSGLGYLVERGLALGKSAHDNDDTSREIDMARLLSRTPTVSAQTESNRFGQLCKSDDAAGAALAEMTGEATSHAAKGSSTPSDRWKGSGLGSEWDERVGAGAAAASISGRLVFATWKVISEEVKHPNCSYLPAVVSSVLNKRIPFHDNLKLAQWYGYDRGRERWRVLHHRLVQATACLQLFDALDIIGRSGEAARLSGVEFSQSFPGIRGSQYKVEGVLLRALQSLNSDERGSKTGRRQPEEGPTFPSAATKSQSQSPWKARRYAAARNEQNVDESESVHHLSDRGYFFFSPSLQDANKQEALETQALTLEPQSGHQQDPVVVCDFTALYPSLVIAYNLCYSTCAGRLDYHSTRSEMQREGKTTGKVGPLEYSQKRTATVLTHHMKSLHEGHRDKDRAYIAPTGTIYISESVVKGVLPQVLDEILSTRAMLKKAAKHYKKLVPDLSPSILRQLEARQLALKYVANVTYGYTSATFSGRCACPLLADTIVECGRRTLTNAINLANQWGKDPNGRWKNIEVIYGDTDSIFVRIPGRSVQEAFRFGEEFCKAVTESNPPPVQLKLEKVYLGSMMQTKKKYCGMKFESKDQRQPTFEAKGLETVRRDQCALTQKILRNCLVTLFQSGIDAVKRYLFRQWALILSGRLPVSDFILTGRVRSRYRGGRSGPVQAVLARRLAEVDPGRTVRHKERQAYVIVATPGVAFKLRDCVLTPMELLEQWDAYTIHSAYYIQKHVNAALQRCLGLAPYHIDVSSWYESSPKPRRRIHFWPATRTRQNTVMISSFFGSDKCSLCGRKCTAGGRSRAAVCHDCRKDPVKAVGAAMKRLNVAQQNSLALARKCNGCNLCFEDSTTFAAVRHVRSNTTTSFFGTRSTLSTVLVTPLSNCSCIDCPITFERHRARESELEATAVCEALDVL